MSVWCQCGVECGYNHRLDCPYPYYGGSDVRTRAWATDREALRAKLLASGEYVRRWTVAPVSYDAWGSFTASTAAVVMRNRPGEPAELREVYVPNEHVEWHEMRWSSGLCGWWTDEALAEAERYGDFRRMTVPVNEETQV